MPSQKTFKPDLEIVIGEDSQPDSGFPDLFINKINDNNDFNRLRDAFID